MLPCTHLDRVFSAVVNSDIGVHCFFFLWCLDYFLSAFILDNEQVRPQGTSQQKFACRELLFYRSAEAAVQRRRTYTVVWVAGT